RLRAHPHRDPDPAAGGGAGADHARPAHGEEDHRAAGLRRPQASALVDSHGSGVAPVRRTAASAASSTGFSASITTRILPALISSSNVRRIGSGSEAPTIADDQAPIMAPIAPIAAAPAKVMPSGGTATATRPASRPVAPP